MIYKYLKYKDYVRLKIKENTDIRGYQSKLAQAAGCQRPYISQVLNGSAELSLEQAMGLVEYWELSESEGEYFLTLVQYARAGTIALKRLLKKKIERVQEEQENLTKRFQSPSVKTIEAQASYYSSWLWSAIHILLTIPSFNSIDKISKKLSISSQEVNSIITGLESMGLIEKKGVGWKLTDLHIHLPKESPFTSINHANWRNRAIQDVLMNQSGSLHYTGVHSLSLDDFEKVKQICLNSIDEAHKIIRPSKEEELVFFGIDFFKV
ncbi:TIGR02147 family protein [Bacteriovorax sp. BSW11_IV]|uniref:TIGR02147 family protein n=1 Tax=Bacteriovorax sp. BSW11_IV TaxID=1353529 RepID=UPI00038A03CF|nr:TIGR02147 family protein [Bacteriovorax sp. BSW11_IV]EQC48747.1 TIGR02147 family protein [Bacteriovorax sp. BSW11_IV]